MKTCLAHNVYSQVSLEVVAREAGLSKGGLRHYFATREELYHALIDDFFRQIENDLRTVLKDLDVKDRAFLSMLYNIEKFLYNRDNMRVLINIILYSFEDRSIMEMLSKFSREQLNMYADIVRDYSTDDSPGDEKDILLRARIAQSILSWIGLLEIVDPISLDIHTLIDYILNLFRHKKTGVRMLSGQPGENLL